MTSRLSINDQCHQVTTPVHGTAQARGRCALPATAQDEETNRAPVRRLTNGQYAKGWDY